jgi:molybdopterin-synthase adenylyltransferase
MSERYSRNEGLFGAEGQKKIGAVSIAIVGLGGLGSPVAQQLAYLGVRKFALIDFDVVTNSSLNRVVTAVDSDVAQRTTKVAAAERTIQAIRPSAKVELIEMPLTEPDAVKAITEADVVFGCLDRDVHRLDLLELCARAGRPYIDLASDTGGSEDMWYGGRVVLNNGRGCLLCFDLLDQAAISRDRMGGAQREVRDRIYGVDQDALHETGPAVVSINSVVASLAVTEFMCMVTQLREPISQLTYRADIGTVNKSNDPGETDCYYCSLKRER